VILLPGKKQKNCIRYDVDTILNKDLELTLKVKSGATVF
jgi:hypothetical protein